MNVPLPQCLHCEARTALFAPGLCPVCNQKRGIRRLYVRRRRGWTPAWERHLLLLTERAKQRLPLFPDAPSGGTQ